MGGQGSGRKPKQTLEPIPEPEEPKKKYAVKITKGCWYFDTQEEARSHAKELLIAGVTFLNVFKTGC